MTERPETVKQAVEDHDITLALTPAQVILVALGLYLLVRFIRSLRD